MNARPDASSTPPTAQPAKSRFAWFKWALLVGLGLIIVYAAVVRPLTTQTSTPQRKGFGARAVPVVAEPARQADLNVRLTALGTVVPVNMVTVRSRVDGQLLKVNFTEGTKVQAGALLAEIDSRPFAVQKMQAEAQLARDRALLENARVDAARFRQLLSVDSVAKQQVDSQDALVRQYEAAVKLDEAQIENATLQITYAHITAPISGRLGLRLVDVGNMVRAADTGGLAVITQLQPISVVFAIPQDALPKVLRRFNAGEQLEVDAYDRDGRTKLASGRLVTIDNQIELSTGTVKLRAEFANEDGLLFPNQFVNVQLLVERQLNATVVPSAAVQTGSIGQYVYVVQDQSAVTVRVVETGASDRGQVMVTKGLQPGDVVVVDGVDKLREGAAVELVSRSGGQKGGGPGLGSGAGGRGEGSGPGKKDRPGGKRKGEGGGRPSGAEAGRTPQS